MNHNDVGPAAEILKEFFALSGILANDDCRHASVSVRNLDHQSVKDLQIPWDVIVPHVRARHAELREYLIRLGVDFDSDRKHTGNMP